MGIRRLFIAESKGTRKKDSALSSGVLDFCTPNKRLVRKRSRATQSSFPDREKGYENIPFFISGQRHVTRQTNSDKKLPAEQVFCICVLETLHWLRSRLKKFSSLPEDICTPEPAQYEAFSMQQLHSFHSSVGAAVDVIYLENRGLWSFQITEPDIGANLGTPQERPAVSGRIFETEISFLLCKDVSASTVPALISVVMTGGA